MRQGCLTPQNSGAPLIMARERKGRTGTIPFSGFPGKLFLLARCNVTRKCQLGDPTGCAVTLHARSRYHVFILVIENHVFVAKCHASRAPSVRFLDVLKRSLLLEQPQDLPTKSWSASTEALSVHPCLAVHDPRRHDPRVGWETPRRCDGRPRHGNLLERHRAFNGGGWTPDPVAQTIDHRSPSNT